MKQNLLQIFTFTSLGINSIINLKKRVIYIAPSKSSFVLQDIAYLSEYFELKSYFFNTKTKWKVPIEMIRLFLYLIISKEAQFLVSFGGYHSFVATLVAKIKRSKCFIILNGTDCANIPEFSYGHLRQGLLKRCCLLSYKWSTKLLPVSHSLLETVNSYAFNSPRKLGLGNFLETQNTQVIPNGFDTDFWKPTTEKEPRTYITVSSNTGLQLKGIDLFIELAKSRPNEKFRIAGMTQLQDSPSNIELLGVLSREDLRKEFSRATYFFQLSIWEGFGCALCEAMLCECIPVVSSVNILPEIVGENCLVLHKRDINELIKEVNEIEKLDNNLNLIRNQIIENYSIQNRISQLLEVLG